MSGLLIYIMRQKSLLTSDSNKASLVKNHRNNHIQERPLILVYSSSFDNLLLKDNSFRSHYLELQKLAAEIFKVEINIAPQVMKDVFQIDEHPYVLRNETKFKFRNNGTARYQIETASFAGPRIWNSIPSVVKESSSVKKFKAKLKRWTQ